MNLNINSTKKKGLVPLLTRMRIGEKCFWIDLKLEVDVQKWPELKSSERKLKNFLDKERYTEHLMKIEFGIDELKRSGQFTKENVDRLIQDIVLKEKREEYLKREKLGREIRERKLKSPKAYVQNLIKQMMSGEARTTKGELYGKYTISAWKQFARIFVDFYDLHPFEWEQIDQKLINRFLNYLEGQNYMKKTRSKYMKNLKQVISDAEKAGYHTNHVAKNLIHSLTVKESDKAREIYLTKEELDALYEMKLEGTEEKVRDLFLIGCFTAQRFSDFTSINENCIGTTAKGVKVIRMEQEKTGNLVAIPIVDDKLETLLQKYNYNVPYVTDQAFNRTIKEIGRRLSETIPQLGIKETTLLKKHEKIAEEDGTATYERDKFGNVVKPRWAMISTHTARRSGITNMYLSGKYTVPQMMSVSGHHDERTFREYVKLSGDELAEMVAHSSVDGMF